MDSVLRYGGTNTEAKYSGTIWADCPWEAIRDGHLQGYAWEKNFDTIPGGAIPTTEGAFGDLALFSSTGGTATNDTTEIGGGLAIGSDGDNEGVGIRTGLQPVRLSLTNGDFWFEARVLSSTVTDTIHDIFLGLIEGVALTASIPITSSDALADQNLCGFFRGAAAGGGPHMSAVYKANSVTAVTVGSNVVTLAASTYTNLGMKWVPKRQLGPGPTSASGYLYWYQDGVLVATYKMASAAGTDFPNDVNMGFVFAVLNSTGTTPGTSSIKHVRMAQLLTPLP